MSISIKNISIVVGGATSSRFDIILGGIEYHLDNFCLYQSLLTHNSLTFSMHKKRPDEDMQDTTFAVCGEIIGKDISVSLETDNIENLSLSSENDKTADIEFRGVIVSASGSRRGSEYDINVEARSWDALLDDNPNCKSFEKKMLNDIVGDVVGDCGNLDTVVDARFADTIPYCVQYNETNFQFLQRLAQRYGEWLYNDGTKLVFGNLIQKDTVRLAYPSQDIPSYDVSLRIQHPAFCHVASSYNRFDSELRGGSGEATGALNELHGKVSDASEQNYTKSTIQNLHSGGYADEDSRDAILSVSTSSQGRGEKAGMLSYSGRTFCSKLKLGSTLVVVDNYITDNLLSTKSDVDQDEILITELTHYFSADEVYSNHFVGIPSASDYPPYADADVYPVATSCRAKVKDNEDPYDLGRIRVQFDWQAQQDASMITPWLRIIHPYAGKEKGFNFIPEIGEEVMVDFEGGNAERPYVKGTIYNGIDNVDIKWIPGHNGDNKIKAIRTRNGHTIEIHDEGGGGYIRIYDNKKENYILTFSTDEKLIKLESTRNIELYAKNDIIMHAGHDITVSAGHDISENAGNDMFLAAGNDQQRTADNDIREYAGRDRSTNIDRNDSLNVTENQFIKIGDNKDEQIEHKLQLTAENIREEAKDQLLEYSKTHHMKAEDSTAINSGSRIDIKSGIVKVQ